MAALRHSGIYQVHLPEFLRRLPGDDPATLVREIQRAGRPGPRPPAAAAWPLCFMTTSCAAGHDESFTGEQMYTAPPKCRLRSTSSLCSAFSSWRIVGAEALARWRHPERGLIPPNRFVPNAPIHHPAGREYIWEEVCKTLQPWLTRATVPCPCPSTSRACTSTTTASATNCGP